MEHFIYMVGIGNKNNTSLLIRGKRMISYFWHKISHSLVQLVDLLEKKNGGKQNLCLPIVNFSFI